MSSVSGKEVKGILDLFKVQKDVDEKKDLYASLENAKKEWEEAKNIFENVSEPDLVDYAIYNIEAAERKYVYLLRKIKSEGSNEGRNEGISETS
ncbi:YaaL family protein [Sedimentibacter hydroxybenzoicus DSM 7310]|uniref:YaaL family protein n=1 Tax=Sedimentibacter hydroxybenzoicus DSM 7310 TaxID=1123245 RepID=A0A974GX27_SEDHY|nr:YaaL family protein [Sedimentibacter hydroxybenzoicus]NYB75127.1 YaaL family protein [Sedimentibacter hydroxybenzoicus DSM 7310]